MATSRFQKLGIFSKPQAQLRPLTRRAEEDSPSGTLRVSDWASEDCNLEELRQQDSDAFAALVEGHQAVVLGLCRSMGLRGADIEDAAADVFANVFRSLPTFDGRAKLGT